LTQFAVLQGVLNNRALSSSKGYALGPTQAEAQAERANFGGGISGTRIIGHVPQIFVASVSMMTMWLA
jgi:hypothetical protein